MNNFKEELKEKIEQIDNCLNYDVRDFDLSWIIDKPNFEESENQDNFNEMLEDYSYEITFLIQELETFLNDLDGLFF